MESRRYKEHHPIGLVKWKRLKVQNFSDLRIKKNTLLQSNTSRIKIFNKLISRVIGNEV
jgi:hypothetical protein